MADSSNDKYLNNPDSETMKNNQSAKQSMPRKPDDIGGVYVQGHIRIFDPSTGEVFVEKRT